MAVPLSNTQLYLAMIYVYMVMTPLVICSLEWAAVLCAVFTAVSVVRMAGHDIIASELENPCGSDPNDLPIYEMQSYMNRIMLLGLEEAVWQFHSIAVIARDFYLCSFCGQWQLQTLRQFRRTTLR